MSDCEYNAYSDPGLLARFAKYTQRDQTTGCLNWIGCRDRLGYGKLWVGRRVNGTLHKDSAHRVAWFISGQTTTPEKPFVMHLCDNPSCCEVTHLCIGSWDENNKDRSRKDRSRRSRRGLPRGVQPNSGCRNSYQARVQIGSRQVYLGSFRSVSAANVAARAGDAKLDELIQCSNLTDEELVESMKRWSINQRNTGV